MYSTTIGFTILLMYGSDPANSQIPRDHKKQHQADLNQLAHQLLILINIYHLRYEKHLFNCWELIIHINFEKTKQMKYHFTFLILSHLFRLPKLYTKTQPKKKQALFAGTTIDNLLALTHLHSIKDWFTLFYFIY